MVTIYEWWPSKNKFYLLRCEIFNVQKSYFQITSLFNSRFDISERFVATRTEAANYCQAGFCSPNIKLGFVLLVIDSSRARISQNFLLCVCPIYTTFMRSKKVVFKWSKSPSQVINGTFNALEVAAIHKSFFPIFLADSFKVLPDLSFIFLFE